MMDAREVTDALMGRKIELVEVHNSFTDKDELPTFQGIALTLDDGTRLRLDTDMREYKGAIYAEAVKFTREVS